MRIAGRCFLEIGKVDDINSPFAEICNSNYCTFGMIPKLKRLFIASIKRLANLGVLLKGGRTGHPRWKRFAVDALIFPLDVLAASGAIKTSGGTLRDLLVPRSFSAKLFYRKLCARSKHHIIWADKLAVRNYVSEKIGGAVLSEMIWEGVELTREAWESFPERFVLKANHASGTNLFVGDKARFRFEDAADVTRGWFGYDHSIGNGEWQYRWIEPKLFVEGYLGGVGAPPPVDYKFFCFHGRAEFVQVDFDRFTNHTRTLFDRRFQPLPFGLLYERYEKPVEPPACFSLMLDLAERLSSSEPFVRVDMYDVGGRPVFGELTLHPGSGGEPFRPHEWDHWCGKFL